MHDVLGFHAASARPRSPLSALARIVALAALTLSSACQTKTDQPAAGADSGAAMSAGASTSAPDSMAGHSMSGMSDSTHAMSGMAGMAGMTGNADQDFLRMMSDHHKGLVAMAHLSAEGEKKGSSAVQADAEKLDAKQDKEIDDMVTMLEREFKDPYTPKVTPDNQAMVDQLKSQTRAAYNRTFYENVVKHHQQALQMINEALPKLQRADLKAMAERMKRDQTAELQEFQRKASGS